MFSDFSILLKFSNSIVNRTYKKGQITMSTVYTYFVRQLDRTSIRKAYRLTAREFGVYAARYCLNAYISDK